MARKFVRASSQYLKDGPNIDLPSEWSMFCWAVIADAIDMAIAGRRINTPNSGWTIGVNAASTGAVSFTYFGVAGYTSSNGAISASTTPQPIFLRRSGGRIYFYANNAAYGNVATGAYIAPGSSVPMYIGTWNENNAPRASALFDGNVSEFTYWDHDIGENAGYALMRGAHPIRFDPTYYWPLHGIETSEPDLSGNAVNLTVVGATKADHAPVNLFTRQRSFIETAAAGGVSVSRTLSSSYEARGLLNLLRAAGYESRQSAGKNLVSQFEASALAGVARGGAFESSLLLGRSVLSVLESLQRVSVLGAAEMESLSRLAVSVQVALESLGIISTPVSRAVLSSYESFQFIQFVRSAALESLRFLARSSVSQIESLQDVSEALLSGVESLQSVGSNVQASMESLALLRSIISSLYECAGAELGLSYEDLEMLMSNIEDLEMLLSGAHTIQ